jgi:hypothetical protein
MMPPGGEILLFQTALEGILLAFPPESPLCGQSGDDHRHGQDDTEMHTSIVPVRRTGARLRDATIANGPTNRSARQPAVLRHDARGERVENGREV